MKEKKNKKYNQLAIMFLLMFVLGFVYIISGNGGKNDEVVSKIVKKNNNNEVKVKNKDFLIYTDKIANAFSIKYPKNWYFESEVGALEHVFFKPSKGSVNKISIISTPVSVLEASGKKYNQKTLKEMALKAIELRKKTQKEVKVLKNDEIKIGDMSGVDVITSYKSKLFNTEIIVRQIVLLSKKNMEFINIDMNIKDQEKIEPIFEEMVQTYKSLIK